MQWHRGEKKQTMVLVSWEEAVIMPAFAPAKQNISKCFHSTQ